MFNPTPEEVEKAILHYLATTPSDVTVAENFLAYCVVDKNNTGIVKIPAWISINTLHLMDIMQGSLHSKGN